jgi:hypothetical protein
MGVQTCATDGTFGMCVCDGVPDGGMPGADGTMPMTDAATTMPPPMVLASGLADPFELALTSTAVFWTNTGGVTLPFRGDVSTVNKDGTGLNTIVPALNRPTQIATDGISVYWFNEQDGTMQYSDPTGTMVGMPINVVSPHRIYGDLVIHNNKLYYMVDGSWVTPPNGSIVMSDINPYNPATAGAGLRNVGGFGSAEATDGTNLFYLDQTNGTLGRSPLAPDMATTTGDVTDIAVGMDQPISVAVDTAPGVFVAERGTGLIDVIDKKGGPSTPIALAVDPTAMALDATFVYWCEESTGTIWKVPRDGSAAPTLLMGSLNNPVSIAVDVDSIYVLERGTLGASFMDGSLDKMPK